MCPAMKTLKLKINKALLRIVSSKQQNDFLSKTSVQDVPVFSFDYNCCCFYNNVFFLEIMKQRTFRGGHMQMFCKKVAPEIFAQFLGKLM